mgnify:CR=1 FL=1|tara:strand:- start:5737 stop:7128 length:1392 start_codon:yes stop_codon:yes gene_type:complete
MNFLENNENNTILWTEKYRPKTLETYLGNGSLIELIKNWIIRHKKKEFDVERFLLLHGSPGVGKTTLAHIIYNTYDYDIIECNASEQRSKKKVAQRIGTIGKASVCFDMEMKRKQVGVIMDEIDGVAGGDKGAIEELIKILEGKKKKKKEEIEKNIKIDENGIKIDKTIKFPVICTCNSIKDKKLQSLLRKSLVIKINKPSESDLNKLAKKIIKNENIKITKNELNKIIISSKKDYRTLISNLYQYNLNNSTCLLSKTKDEIELEEVSCEKPITICNFILNKQSFNYEENSKIVEGDENIFFLNIYSNYLKLLTYNKINKTKSSLIQQISNNVCYYDKCKNFFYSNSFHGYDEKYYVMVGIIHNLLLLKQMIKKNKYQLEHHANYNYYLQEKSNISKKLNIYEYSDEKEKQSKKSDSSNFNFYNNNKKYNLDDDIRDFRYMYLNRKKNKAKDKISNIISKILE